MKAKKPYWELERVKRLAAAGQLLLTETKVKASFESFEAASAAVHTAIASLTEGAFAQTLRQLDVCDVHGVTLDAGGWYLKATIDAGPPEELVVVSYHPLRSPLRTNRGVVNP